MTNDQDGSVSIFFTGIIVLSDTLTESLVFQDDLSIKRPLKDEPRAGHERDASWLLSDRAASYRVANGLRLMSQTSWNGIAYIGSRMSDRERLDRLSRTSWSRLGIGMVCITIGIRFLAGKIKVQAD
uniref:Uncharacterized protein n=1 Tax=Brassica oleracea TaxID=3712 RepID=Q2A9R8_BRAOL|nr:hypothetical protein 25.t00046 [Brassica oleracea]